VLRHDETFSIAVPVGFFAAISYALWPYRRRLAQERAAQEIQAA
jgi:hypothetical protein